MRPQLKHRAGLAMPIGVVLLVLVGCGSGEAEQTPRDLWGRAFVSTAITEEGEPRELVPDTRIGVTFEEREDRSVVQWNAGCNFYGAEVEITAESLVVGGIEGTAIGCRDEFEEQDEWLAGFFESDPRWRLSDDRLTLTSEETVIELEARSD